MGGEGTGPEVIGKVGGAGRGGATHFHAFSHVWRGEEQFGTVIASCRPETRTNHSKRTTMERYSKLKEMAMRLMAAGDLRRYLHALRLMHDLRARTAAVA